MVRYSAQMYGRFTVKIDRARLDRRLQALDTKEPLTYSARPYLVLPDEDVEEMKETGLVYLKNLGK